MNLSVIKNKLLSVICFLQATILLLMFLSCKIKDGSIVKSDADWFKENAELTKNFDSVSNTTYYLTRIRHKDTNGKLIKLRMEITNKAEGETVRDFAIRRNTEVAINGSMGLSVLPENQKQPVGIRIIDGVIKQDLQENAFTLGIRKDNELVSYPPGVTASEMIKNGVTTALTAFVPLILM